MPDLVEVYVCSGGREVAHAVPETGADALLAVRTLWDDAVSGLQGQRLLARVYGDGVLAKEYDRRP